MSNLNFPSTYKPPETSRLDYFYDRPGTIPGQLHLSPDAQPAELVLIDYDRDRATRVSITDPEQIKEHLQTHTVSWIDVLGLGNTATWDALIPIFDLHRMLVEESEFGWQMVEKFDGSRDRLKRQRQATPADAFGRDPYRTTYGVTEGALVGMIFLGIGAAFSVILLVIVLLVRR